MAAVMVGCFVLLCLCFVGRNESVWDCESRFRTEL